jgi:hypothetical protein
VLNSVAECAKVHYASKQYSRVRNDNLGRRAGVAAWAA